MLVQRVYVRKQKFQIHPKTKKSLRSRGKRGQRGVPSRHARSSVRSHRAYANGPPRGQAAVLVAMRHGGELRRLAGL